MAKSHEVHLFCTARSRRLAALCGALPALRPNTSCDPANVPPGTVCYEYPQGKEPELEFQANQLGLRFEWGIVGPNFIATFFVGDYLYSVSDADTLHIHDVSDPTTPTEVGTVAIAAVPTAVWVDSGLCYTLSDDGTLSVIDVDDPTAPEVISTVDTGDGFTRLKVTGDLIVLSGESATRVALYNARFSPPREVQQTANAGSGVDLQGRRLFFGDVSGGNLRNYRTGGFRCSSATFDELLAVNANAERFHGRHGYFKGEVVAHSVTVAEGGNLSVSGVINLGGRYILAVTGDPNGAVTAPIGSIGLSSTGAVYRNTDGATAWTAM